MRTSRLVTNAAANGIGFVTQVIVAFVASPILVHHLGDNRYGVWSLVESVLVYFTLFDFGVGASVVRYVARFEACADHDRLNRVFSTSLAIFAAFGALAFALVVAVAQLGATPLGVPASFASDTQWLFLLLGANLTVSLTFGVYPAVLEGLGHFPTKNAIRSGLLLLRTALMITCVYRGGGLPELAGIVLLCNIGEHLGFGLAAHRALPVLRCHPSLCDLETLRTIAGYSLNAFLAMVAGRISFQTDALVIGAFLAPRFITFFVIAARLVNYSKELLRAVTAVLTSAVSSLEARGDHANIRQLFVDGTRWVLLLAVPVQVGLIVLGRPFLRLWLGADYVAPCYPVLLILSAPLALALSQSVSARILYGTGQLRWFSRAMLAEALCNLALSLILVRSHGIEGVAWGTTVPNVIANIAVAWYTGRSLGVSLRDYVVGGFVRPLMLMPVPIVIWAVGQCHGEPTSWLELIVLGALGLASYALLAAIVEFGPRRLTAAATTLARTFATRAAAQA
jgi:O-antigen/teichoic acid export membrane protein